MTESPVLVCRRVCDLASPSLKSHRGVYCALCGTEVWVALSSPFIETVWCTQCAAEESDDDDVKMGMTQEQLEDVLEYLHRKGAS